MKNKWFLIILMGFMIGLMSSCNQMDDVIGKAKQLLDNQLSINKEETEDLNNDSHLVSNDSNNNQDNESSQEINDQKGEKESINHLPFDERLRAQGYEIISDLPNGLPFEVPYHWILVEDNTNNPSAESFIGTFCFDLPLEIEQIANHFDHFDEIKQQHFGLKESIIHTTTFAMDFGYETVDGALDYFIDEYDNTCAKTTISFVDNEMNWQDNIYGEDPATMISEEELALEQERIKEAENALQDSQSRERVLVNHYEERLKRLLDKQNLVGNNKSELLSIRDKISNGDIEMLSLSHGYPKIFPYEWYLIEVDSDYTDSDWNGTFCTDAPLTQTITKHHNMLAEYEADIIDFTAKDNPHSNEKSNVEFAFNDEYGTGSWHGNTSFFINDTGPLSMHKCAKTSMVFSDIILP